jgi:hypothetical protein
MQQQAAVDKRHVQVFQSYMLCISDHIKVTDGVAERSQCIARLIQVMLSSEHNLEEDSTAQPVRVWSEMWIADFVASQDLSELQSDRQARSALSAAAETLRGHALKLMSSRCDALQRLTEVVDSSIANLCFSL